jgi:hypothetical protein
VQHSRSRGASLGFDVVSLVTGCSVTQPGGYGSLFKEAMNVTLPYSKPSQWKSLFKIHKTEAGGGSVVEHLPSMCEALGSSPATHTHKEISAY